MLQNKMSLSNVDHRLYFSHELKTAIYESLGWEKLIVLWGF